MAAEKYQEGYDPSVAPPSVADVFGTLAAYLIFLALVQFLWVDLSDMTSRHRALALVALGLMGMRGAHAGIGPDSNGRPRAPGTGRALGLLAWVVFALALFELGRAFHIPPSGWAELGMGGAALFAAQALSHSLLALIGAALVHSHASSILALQLGLAGSWGTDAIFVNMGVALVQVLVGRWRIRVGARTSGVALVGWGGVGLLFGAYLLSLHGGGYVGAPDSRAWRWAFQALFVLLSLRMLRVGRLSGSVLLQLTASLLLFFRGLIWYIEAFGGLTDRAFYLALGLLFLLLAFRVDRGPADTEATDSPAARPEGGPGCRRFGLSVARRVMVLLVAIAAFRGAWNSTGVRHEARIPIEGQVMPPLVFLQIPPTAVEYPHDVSPGTRLDVHVQVVSFFAEEALLVPGRIVATRPGEDPPPAFDRSRTLTVPGTLVRGRAFTGGAFELVLAHNRMILEVPPEMRYDAIAGRKLVMREGRAGFVYPAALRGDEDREVAPGASRASCRPLGCAGASGARSSSWLGARRGRIPR